MRCIYCPGVDKWVPLASYVRGVKRAKANPDVEFRQGITCWWPCTGTEIMRQFMRGINDRINQAVPYYLRGLTNEKATEGQQAG